MDSLTSISQLLDGHSGYSDRERAIWKKFAEKLPKEKLERLAEFMKINTDKLPPDIRHNLKKDNLEEQINDAFIKAQTILSSSNELTSWVEKINETYKKIEKEPLSAEIINKFSNKIESEDDAIKTLIAAGPEGLEDSEESLAEDYINSKTPYSFEETIDMMHNLVHSKNVIVKENYQFMIDTINIYNKHMKRINEIQKGKLDRAKQIFTAKTE